MAQIYDSLKSHISREMISRASALVEENESNVSNAVSSIMASLLGVMLKNGDTQQIKNILEESGKLNILSHAKNIFEENPTQDQQRIGDDFLQHLLGDKAEDFTAPIASHSGISKVATNRLVSMLAPIFCGELGNKLVKENWSMPHLMSSINNQLNSFKSHIPSGLIKSFGLSSVLNQEHAKNVNTKTKKNRNWIIWVVVIVLILLCILLWRSCNKNKVEKYDEVDVITNTEPKVANSPKTTAATIITLPNGVKLNAYSGGTEDQMIKFLQSEEYKKATNKELEKKWFFFDNIDFEFNSTTQLMSGSQTQLNNIIEILKYFTNAKVSVVGFADKVGTEQVNMEVSKQRAKTIESMLDKGGLSSQIVKTEGFGETYAKHSEKESNIERAPDRDIAIRFVK